MALLVPSPWDGEVDGLRRAVGDGALTRMPPHLTLAPPVNVRDDRLDAALAVLRQAAGRAAPLTVTLGPPATFLPDTPVLYLAVGGPGLAALHRLRHDIFVAPLERRLTWPFEPHVTLADEASPERIAAATVALADYRTEVTFDRVHLLEEGAGRVWRLLADVALEAPAVAARGSLEIEVATSADLDPEASRWAERVAGEASHRTTPLAVTARRQGEVVGALRGWVGPEVAYFMDIVVGPGQRHQGVGSHLLGRFVAEAAVAGARRARATTEAGSPAEAFLRARGWHPESEPDGGGAAVELVRRLP